MHVDETASVYLRGKILSLYSRVLGKWVLKLILAVNKSKEL